GAPHGFVKVRIVEEQQVRLIHDVLPTSHEHAELLSGERGKRDHLRVIEASRSLISAGSLECVGTPDRFSCLDARFEATLESPKETYIREAPLPHEAVELRS